MSAHLCLMIKVEDNKPEIIGADIYSESPMTLTAQEGIYYAELLFSAGDSYNEERKNILNILKMLSKRYGWLYQYFPELQI